MCKKFIKWGAIALAGFAVIVATQPDSYHVERSLVINAPAAKIYAQVNDLHQWDAWSPWAKIDPNAKSTFEGTKAGKGAIMRWEGNNEVGAGSMEITETEANKRIAMKLDFLKPMKGEATSEFTFVPEGKGTKVTWSMDGKSNFVGKAMGLIFNCDKMIGDKYEEGLASLQKVVKG